jgi:flagellin
MSASESSIRDTDVAEEVTTFTKNQILVQASTSLLAQANAVPQNALSLLQ